MKMLSLAAMIGLVSAAAYGGAPAEEKFTFDDAAALSGPGTAGVPWPDGWTVTGDAAIDASKNHAGAGGGALRLGPGGKAVKKFSDTDASGKVEMWVYEELANPKDLKERRVGPRWGIMQGDGRVLVMGIIYAPYLSGGDTYVASDSDQKMWFSVQHSRLKRQTLWHKWTFDFDAEKGLVIKFDDKKTAAFDWNRTQIKGFSGVALFGDSSKDQQQTVWIDDITIQPGGPMKVVPVPPPPPPPVVPDKDPPAEKAVELVPAVRGKHPRLLFTAEDVPRIKRLAETPQGKIFVEQLMAYLPSCKPPEDTKFLTDATDAQRQGMWRLPTVALDYVLTRRKESLEAAAGYLKKFAELENWETGKERDCGMGAANIMVGAALAYDWLYDDLDPALRDTMRRKILLQARRMYHAGHLMKLAGTHYWQPDPQNNHRFHRDAGLALSVLAVAGETPEADWITAETAKELKFINDWLPEDGTCHESASYMIFGGPYLALAMDSSDRCLGTRFLEHPFFKYAPLFRMQTLAPGLKDAFPYGDSGGLGFINNYMFKYASRHRAADLQAGLWKFFETGQNPFMYGWFSLIWFDPTLAGGSIDRLPQAVLFPDLGIATLRDGWAAGNVAAMFKCGPYGGRKLNEYRNANQFHYINVAHDDPDANMFTIFAGGQFLADDDRYAAKKLTRSHNTILVNGKGQRGEGGGWTQPLRNVDMASLATVTTWKDTGAAAVAEGEAGGMYDGLERFRRAFIWVRGGYILVLDDIRAPKEAEFTWLVQGPQVEKEAGGWRLEAVGKSPGPSPQPPVSSPQPAAAACPFRVVADREFAAAIGDSAAESRGTPLGYKQLSLTARAPRLRIAAAFNPWNHAKLDVQMKATDDAAAVVTVTGRNFTDEWRWQAAPDPKTPSTIQGARPGGFTISVGPQDKAPLGGPPVSNQPGKEK